MPSISDSTVSNRNMIAWLCLCPLLAVTATWQLALTLAIGLLVCIAATAGVLVPVANVMLRLPVATLSAGTVVVLEHLALAAWWPSLDAAVAPWLVLVAGLAVLVCVSSPRRRGSSDLGHIKAKTLDSGFRRNDEQDACVVPYCMKLATKLSAVLLLVGIARDGFGRVFLLAETPAGALLLLALLLAAFKFVMRDFESSSQPAALSSLDSGVRRGDEQT